MAQDMTIAITEAGPKLEDVHDLDLDADHILTHDSEVLYIQTLRMGKNVAENNRQALLLWQQNTENFNKHVAQLLTDFTHEIDKLRGTHQSLIYETEVHLDHIVSNAQSTSSDALRAVFDELVESVALRVSDSIRDEGAAKLKVLLEHLGADLAKVVSDFQTAAALIQRTMEQDRQILENAAARIEKNCEVATAKAQEDARLITISWKRRLASTCLIVLATSILSIISSCWLMGNSRIFYPNEIKRLIQDGEFLDNFWFQLTADKQKQLIDLANHS